MLKRFGSKGFGHHFLFPVIAVFAVGAIGYYMVNASGAAPDRPRYKRAMVDDGPYASRASVDPTSKIRDYLSGGTSNKYAFAITNGQMYHTVLNVGVNELVTVADDGTTKYIPGSLEMRIANAVEWNKANPTKRLNVHIRFHVGGRAPDKWKELCGTVRMEDPQFGGAVDTPRWWVKDAAGYTYRRLYSNAMKALAPAVTAINSNESTKYIIGTVNAPGAAPNYPEPMILYASSSAVRSALASGGFTAAEHNSFMKWFPKASAAFKEVGVELALNPYQNISADRGYSGADSKLYKDVASSLISAVGAKRTILANYSAREEYTKTTRGQYHDMYNWMSEMAKASDPVWVGVQMARPHNVAAGNSDTNEQWDNVARWAAAKGFHFAETTGPRAKAASKPAPHGLANIWPTSYNDDENDISDMVSIRKAFMKNSHPSVR